MNYFKNISIFFIILFLTFGCGDDSNNKNEDNLCENFQCEQNQHCEIIGNSAVCICDSGFYEENGICIEDIIDPCEDILCSNHGECIVENSIPKCICDVGYNPGPELSCIEEIVIDPCEGIYCGGFGICLKDQNNEPYCDCNEGYIAQELTCIEEIIENSCENIDCGGNGVCIEENGEIFCSCDQNYHDFDNNLICSDIYKTVQLGSSEFESGTALESDIFGNIWVTGEFTGDINFEGCDNIVTSESDISSSFIAKISPDNRCEKLFSFNSTDYIFISDLESDNQGNIYITGYFGGNSNISISGELEDVVSDGESDIFILKITNSGEYLDHIIISGEGDQYSTSLFTHNGSIYLTGNYQGVTNFGSIDKSSNGEGDIFVVKFTQNFNTEWVYSVGSVYDDIGNDIFVNNEAIYLVAEFSGTVNFNNNGALDKKISVGKDGVLVKIDHNGIEEWSRQFGGDLDDYLSSVVVDSDGNIFVGGSFIDIADFNWDQTYEDIFIADGHLDIFVTKVGSEGEYIETLFFEGMSEDDFIKDMVIDQNDNIYITGSFSDLIDFNPYEGEDYKITEGESDIFVITLSKTGYIESFTFGEDLDDSGNGIAVDKFNGLTVTGYWKNSANFSPYENISDEITSLGGRDMFIWRYFR